MKIEVINPKALVELKKETNLTESVFFCEACDGMCDGGGPDCEKTWKLGYSKSL